MARRNVATCFIYYGASIINGGGLNQSPVPDPDLSIPMTDRDPTLT